MATESAYIGGVLVAVTNGRLDVNAGALTTALPAGEGHIGEIGGNSRSFKIAPTVDTAVYASGDTVGGKLTLTSICRASGQAVTVTALTGVDEGNQKPTGNLLIFDADPSASTLTDNAAFVLHTNDSAKVIGRINIASSNWVTVGAAAHLLVSNVGLVLTPASGSTLYAAFVTDGAPDMVGTDDLLFVLHILRD